MIEKTIDGVTVECIRGDISDQPDVESVVNAANAQLRVGGGVAGAIHRAAGPGLEEECRPLAPIRPGEAVITGAHNLPNQYVIHCLGPVYGRDEPSEELLASCYREALQLAEENGISSVAFPAISTGAFGYPMEEAGRIAIRTVLDALPALRSVERIRFVLFSERARSIHENVLEEMTGEGTGDR
ncbi:MAG: macro domain-containing protein [Candidatus Brocadiia bacterium]